MTEHRPEDRSGPVPSPDAPEPTCHDNGYLAEHPEYVDLVPASERSRFGLDGADVDGAAR